MAATTPFLQLHRFGDLDLAEFDLKLRSFDGREALSSLFQFHLHLHFAREQASELDHEQILGRRAVFSVDETNFFSGIVSSVAVTGLDDEARCHLSAILVPELWKLTEIHDSRRHKKTPVATLVGDLLKEYGLDLTLVDKTDRDADAHPRRTNPVQYDESVYNFLARHMREEGIFYYFQEEYELKQGEPVGRQTLVLGDGPDDYHETKEPLVLQFQPTGNVVSPETVIQWHRQFRFRPGQWSISDYNYHHSRDFSMTKQAVGGGAGQYRKFKRGAGFFNKKYGEYLQRRMDEQENVGREFLHGSSFSSQLFPGCVFELQGHPIDRENGRYIVASVEHAGTVYDSVHGTEREYENILTCVPFGRVPVVCPNAEPTRLPPATRPQQFRGSSVGAAQTRNRDADTDFDSRRGLPDNDADSVQAPQLVAETAFVVDAQGSYEDPATVGTVNTRTVDVEDDQGHVTGTLNTGEVQVRFPWETTPVVGRWLRVAQPMAGVGAGAKFLPRVGDEVVVLYIDGQDRKPLVMGSVYNNTTKLPDQLPDNAKTKMQTVQYENLLFKNWEDGGPELSDEGETHASPKSAPDATTGLVVPRINETDVIGLQSKPIPNDSGSTSERGNEFLFKDTSGSEQIYLHAQKEFNVEVEKDWNIEIKGDKREIIRGNYYQVVNMGPNVAVPGNAENGYFDEGHQQVPYPAPYGGVAKSVVDGVDIAYDKVVGIKKVEPVMEADGVTQKTRENPLSTTCPKERDLVFLMKSETLADTEDRVVGDAKDVRVGDTKSYHHGDSFSEHFGNDESRHFGTINELMGGNTASLYLGAKEELMVGNTLGLYVGAKEEMMIGLALDIFLGSKAEFFIGNLSSIHAGSKFEIGPDNKEVNAKWAMHAGSFGVVALTMGISALATKIKGKVDIGGV